MLKTKSVSPILESLKVNMLNNSVPRTYGYVSAYEVGEKQSL